MFLFRRRALISRKCKGVAFVLIFGLFWMVYLQVPEKINDGSKITVSTSYTHKNLRALLENLTLSNRAEISSSTYLVHSSKCKIPNIDPFDPEIFKYYSPEKYVTCRDKPLLTQITKKGNVATLYIDEEVKKEYTEQEIHCCYSYITRGATDNDLFQEDCIEFKNPVTLTKDTVLIHCLDENAEEIYKNIHNVILINKHLKPKLQKQPWSILFFGIDSTSRLNLLRSLPKTHQFLQQNNWIEFRGYNKINDNTFPNLMAILTGHNFTWILENCDPRVYSGLDKCKFIWSDFQRLGFITSYAEDAADMSTFNWYKHGFRYVPTDYYFRSYMLAAEKYLNKKLVDSMNYCTGPEASGERIFNVMRDFVTTFEKQSKFGFFWTNTFSHEKLNSVSRFDDNITTLLTDLQEKKVYEKSIVVLISDHGFRFGNYSYTHTGWLEERLPAFYISLPPWFKKAYPVQTMNLMKNTVKLTTPFDLYMTLQDILVLSGKKYHVRKSSSCPKCKSLFENIEVERSCEDAGIPLHWCTCNGYFTIPLTSPIVVEAAKFILNEVHKTILKHTKDIELCQSYEVDTIISAGISDMKSMRSSSNVYFLISFLAKPDAVFRATVSFNLRDEVPSFKLEGSVSRLDIYKEKSWCVSDAILRKYCYCEKSMTFTKYVYTLIKTGYLKLFS